jgi:hypothetical protein
VSQVDFLLDHSVRYDQWIYIGERGNVWIRHEQQLNYTTPFQVLIEGVVGSSFLSDIGLDDTIFTPDCTFSSSIDLPTTIIPTTTTPKPCPVPDQFRCPTGDICIDQDKVRIRH